MEAGFIADFQDDVVESVDFPGDLSSLRLVAGNQVHILERLNVLVIARAYSLNIVSVIQGHQGP